MREIPLADFVALHDDSTVVVDVREPEEYVEGHVPGALHIPLGQLPTRTGEVPGGGTVYCICRSGVRSQKGAAVLEAAGLDAVSVMDGTLGWVKAGQEVALGSSPRA